MKLPDKKYIKKNPAYYLALDADHIFSLAETAQKKKNLEAEGIYSRSAILLYPIALEALINMVCFVHQKREKEPEKFTGRDLTELA